MGLADVVDERQEPDSKVWDKADTRKALETKMRELKEKSANALKAQGFDDDSIKFEEYLNMRYRGTETALMVIVDKESVEVEFDGDEWAFGKAFIKQHQQEFGFTLPNRDIIVDDVRVRGIGKSFSGPEKTVDQQLKDVTVKEVTKQQEHKRAEVFFEGGRVSTAIFKIDDLSVGCKIQGPAILVDGTQTIILPPGSHGLVIETHVVINIGEEGLRDG
jgi:5-oxoprolinase (ATP-hydrolysing)